MRIKPPASTLRPFCISILQSLCLQTLMLLLGYPFLNLFSITVSRSSSEWPPPGSPAPCLRESLNTSQLDYTTNATKLPVGHEYPDSPIGVGNDGAWRRVGVNRQPQGCRSTAEWATSRSWFRCSTPLYVCVAAQHLQQHQIIPVHQLRAVFVAEISNMSFDCRPAIALASSTP